MITTRVRLIMVNRDMTRVGLIQGRVKFNCFFLVNKIVYRTNFGGSESQKKQ